MEEDLKLFPEKEIIPYMPDLMWIIFGIFFLISFFALISKIRDRKLLKTVTKPNRGTRTEKNLVLKLLKSGIPVQTIFHDLYVKKYKGDFSQIDLVVATKIGIIVFEVKDYSGWIFGNGQYTQWTQVLAYGENIKIQIQHMENIKDMLGNHTRHRADVGPAHRTHLFDTHGKFV